jgi:glutathione S-transferase
MADAGNNEQHGLTLLGLHVSPFALRARMALNLKGLSYEYVEQDLFHKSELLLSSNPVHNKVPVLIHNGKPICESLVVVEYIDEVWPAGTDTGTGAAILPADPYSRAVARFWAAYIDGKMFPSWVGVMKAATEEERAEKVRETHAAVLNMEKAFAEISSNNGGNGAAFFGGDSVGYVELWTSHSDAPCRGSGRCAPCSASRSSTPLRLRSWRRGPSGLGKPTWPRRSCRSRTRLWPTPRRFRPTGLLLLKSDAVQSRVL